MGGGSPSEAEYALRKALALEGPTLTDAYPWMWEADRWKELVFSLLTFVVDWSDTDVRELTERLRDAGLLDVGDLAAGGSDSSASRHLLAFLQENGLTSEEASRGVSVISDAAIAFKEHFDGKVQRYLRHYGELMLDELDRYFRFRDLDAEERRHAFTFWLQNVANLPVSLLDQHVERFAREHGVSPSDLIAAADDMDLNLALLDDLVQRYLERRAAAAGG